MMHLNFRERIAHALHRVAVWLWREPAPMQRDPGWRVRDCRSDRPEQDLLRHGKGFDDLDLT
jgi:hypothetical protein